MKPAASALIAVGSAAAGLFAGWLVFSGRSAEPAPAPAEVSSGTVAEAGKASVARPQIPQHAEGGSRAEEIAALRAELEEAMKGRLDERRISDILEEIQELLADEDFSKKERKFVRTLREALEDNNVNHVRMLARSARRYENPGVRKVAVEALGWFGEDCMKELQLFIQDGDPEVSEEALNQFELALQMCDDETAKFAALKEFMTGCKDEGNCEYVSMNLITAVDQKLAVRTITELMASSNEACKPSAKEAYEWITDSEWTDSAAAEAWISKQ